MKILVVVVFVLLTSKVLCQSNCCLHDSASFQKVFEKKLFGDVKNLPPYLNVQFVYEQWAPATIVLQDNSVITDKLLKYNGFTDEVFCFFSDGLISAVLLRGCIKRVEFYQNNRKVTFLNAKIKLKNKKDSIHTYMEVLTEGTISLYSIRKISLEAKNKYTPKYKYLVKLPNGNFKEIIPRNKNLLKLFPAKQSEIDAILKAGNFNIKREWDFINVIGKMNLINVS